MAKVKLIERISQGLFFLDGGMGSQLIARGVDAGDSNDCLNIKLPEVVKAIHADYFSSGSDAVITNTFGGNAISLARHGHADKAAILNKTAAEIARQAASQDRYVIGDIGPCGDFLEPLGQVRPDQLKAAFSEQALALAAGGVDGFIIETMTAIDEIIIAVDTVKSVSDLPIFLSLAYDDTGDGFKTMMGVSPADIVDRLGDSGIAALGFNCGSLDMAGYIKLTEIYAELLSGSEIKLLAEPNAGRPQLIDDKVAYNLSPKNFAIETQRIHDAGASIIGGCCGTGPKHIKAMAKRLRA